MEQERPVILLTGQPHIGKSTIIQKVVEFAASKSGGFYTKEVHSHGKRIGFEIVSLKGQSALLATKDPSINFNDWVFFESYKINLDAINKVAVPALLDAVNSKKLVVIDEIGPMEIFSESFCNVVLNIINNPQVMVVGTIVQRPYVIADTIKAHPRVRIKLVTTENRNDLPVVIYSTIMEHLYE